MDDQAISENDFPQPIHNWRNEDIYEKKRTNKEWGWEFLRRNRNYQFDITRYQLKAKFEEYELIEIDAGKEFDKRFVKLPEEKDGYITIKPSAPLDKVIAEKYGFRLSGLCGFKTELPEDSDFFFIPKASMISNWGYSKNRDAQLALYPRNEEDYVVRFDLGGSIEKQIRLIKNTLKVRAEMANIKEFRIPKNKNIYISYLRLLDAIAENPKITDLDLAGVLCPHKLDDEENAKQNIKNWKRASKRLVNRDYLKIIIN